MEQDCAETEPALQATATKANTLTPIGLIIGRAFNLSAR
jgi:hypothetical protein